ncbi:MAG: head-tail connector protein [Hyphomicrobiaceae bacterium]
MTLVPIGLPAVEPLTLAEIKSHLRLDHGEEDALIASLLSAARLHLEMLLSSAFVTQSWRLVLDRWPDDGIVAMPLAPVRTIDEVRLRDGSGASVVIDAARWFLAPGPPARLAPGGSMIWPQPGRPIAGIEIDFTAGFGDTGDDVPGPIRQALRLLVADWYERRQPVDLGEPLAFAPAMVERLLDPYRRRRIL